MVTSRIAPKGSPFIILAILVGTQSLVAGAEERPGEPIWGLPTSAVKLSAKTEREAYRKEEHITVIVRMRCVGELPVEIVDTEGCVDYRLWLFRENGQPVPLSQGAEKAGKQRSTREGAVLSIGGTTIRPGTDVCQELLLDEWFNEKKAGSYFLVIMRRVGRKGEELAVANGVRFKIQE